MQGMQISEFIALDNVSQHFEARRLPEQAVFGVSRVPES
jgi:hypothetical protein